MQQLRDRDEQMKIKRDLRQLQNGNFQNNRYPPGPNSYRSTGFNPTGAKPFFQSPGAHTGGYGGNGRMTTPYHGQQKQLQLSLQQNANWRPPQQQLPYTPR